MITNLSGKSVALIAMGGSRDDFFQAALTNERVYDEVWAVNSMAAFLRCDRAFFMDPLKAILDSDLPIHQPMKRWLSRADVPVYTSVPDRRCPAAVDYPLRAVYRAVRFGYFATTVGYAVGFAIAANVRRLAVFGCDFTYPDAHVAERGRANTEFLLAHAIRDGMEVAVGNRSTLFEAYAGGIFYGYPERPDLTGALDDDAGSGSDGSDDMA